MTVSLSNLSNLSDLARKRVAVARIDSDWDILIILDKEKLEPEDYDKVSFPLTMLGWDLGARINPIMYTMKEWAASCITPFYKNVEQEGIELV